MAKIILHAKSPTFRAAKLKGFTVCSNDWLHDIHYSVKDAVAEAVDVSVLKLLTAAGCDAKDIMVRYIDIASVVYGCEI